MKPISYTKLPLFLTTKAYASGEHVYVEGVSGVTDGHYTSNEAISAGSFDSTKWTYVDSAHYVAQGLPIQTIDSAMSSSSENPVQNKIVKSYVDTTASGFIPIQNNAGFHNSIVRCKDITSYYTDGSLWDRINGTNGYALFEDLYLGDYFQMSRPISAYEQTQTYQTTGSQYVTIAGFDWYLHSGDTELTTHHIVLVAGQGEGGTQHFGRSRMNSSNSTTGCYTSSEMHTTTIGAVTSSGSTASNATINQQLYAEFGSHLLTSRELLSTAINATGYNRFGTNSGCVNSWAWASCQAVLLSEIECYGSIAFSSAGQDTGTGFGQLPLFALSKGAKNNRSSYYWLKDVASSACFCYCNYAGNADYGSAGRADGYVRPRFLLS